MVQQIAASITRYSISRNWIDASQREWCQYAMEKQFGQLLFGCMSLLLMICTQTWLPMISFTKGLRLPERILSLPRLSPELRFSAVPVPNLQPQFAVCGRHAPKPEPASHIPGILRSYRG